MRNSTNSPKVVVSTCLSRNSIFSAGSLNFGRQSETLTVSDSKFSIFTEKDVLTPSKAPDAALYIAVSLIN